MANTNDIKFFKKDSELEKICTDLPCTPSKKTMLASMFEDLGQYLSLEYRCLTTHAYKSNRVYKRIETYIKLWIKQLNSILDYPIGRVTQSLNSILGSLMDSAYPVTVGIKDNAGNDLYKWSARVDEHGTWSKEFIDWCKEHDINFYTLDNLYDLQDPLQLPVKASKWNDGPNIWHLPESKGDKE